MQKKTTKANMSKANDEEGQKPVTPAYGKGQTSAKSTSPAKSPNAKKDEDWEEFNVEDTRGLLMGSKKKKQKIENSLVPYGVDVMIMPVKQIEYEGCIKLLESLEINFENHGENGMLFEYNSLICQIIVPMNRQGHSAIASATSCLLSKYQPRAILMVGMARGIEKKFKLFDVAFIEKATEMDLGGYQKGIFTQEMNMGSCDPVASAAVNTISGVEFAVRTTSGLSGNQVIEGKNRVMDLMEKHFRKLGVYEMEAASFYKSVEFFCQSMKRPVISLGVFKGIADIKEMDRGDMKKENQLRASKNAFSTALMVIDFVSRDWPPPSIPARQLLRMHKSLPDLQDIQEKLKKQWKDELEREGRLVDGEKATDKAGKTVKIKFSQREVTLNEERLKDKANKLGIKESVIKDLFEKGEDKLKIVSVVFND